MFPEKGRIIIADRAVDLKTGTLSLVAEFPNPNALLRPGQFGRVRLAATVAENALLVPQKAVTEMQSAKVVYVVGAGQQGRAPQRHARRSRGPGLHRHRGRQGRRADHRRRHSEGPPRRHGESHRPAGDLREGAREEGRVAMAKFFIHRPVFAIVISLIILIAGGISIFTLPIAQYPQISPPTVEVEINYPGANAETVEQSIATNVEAEVNGAENMIYMSSKSSSDGRYVLTCTFKVGANLDLANVDINNRVNKATAKLPQEAIASGISVKKKSPDILLAISVYSPDSTFDETFLSNFTSINLVDPIARTPGRRLDDDRRPARLRHALLGSARQAGQARADGHRSRQRDQRAEPGGSRRTGRTAAGQGRHAVPVHGERQGPPDRPVRIREHDRPHAAGRLHPAHEGRLARRTLRQELHQLRPQGRHPGHRADHLSAPRRQRHSDRGERAEAAGGIEQELSRPGSSTAFRWTPPSSSRWPFDEVFLALRDAIILVLIVVFIFLGNFRATFIPMLAVPVSLVGTFAAFVALGSRSIR